MRTSLNGGRKWDPTALELPKNAGTARWGQAWILAGGTQSDGWPTWRSAKPLRRSSAHECATRILADIPPDRSHSVCWGFISRHLQSGLFPRNMKLTLAIAFAFITLTARAGDLPIQKMNAAPAAVPAPPFDVTGGFLAPTLDTIVAGLRRRGPAICGDREIGERMDHRRRPHERAAHQHSFPAGRCGRKAGAATAAAAPLPAGRHWGRRDFRKALRFWRSLGGLASGS